MRLSALDVDVLGMRALYQQTGEAYACVIPQMAGFAFPYTNPWLGIWVSSL